MRARRSTSTAGSSTPSSTRRTRACATARRRLVEKAEALAPKGEDGIAAYRELLDQWKTAGRAGKKVDDALWARFKAAGDALYGARVEREAADAEASREKIEAKRALLEEARAIADERDIVKARSTLTGDPASLGRHRPHLPARHGARARRRSAQDRAGAARPRRDRLEAQQPRDQGARERHDAPADRGDREARGRARGGEEVRRQGRDRQGAPRRSRRAARGSRRSAADAGRRLRAVRRVGEVVHRPAPRGLGRAGRGRAHWLTCPRRSSTSPMTGSRRRSCPRRGWTATSSSSARRTSRPMRSRRASCAPDR